MAFAILRRGIGKTLVAIGTFNAIALAVTAPIAFIVELRTPVELMLLALLGAVLTFALFKVGDLIADGGRPSPALAIGTMGEIPIPRHSRDRFGRARVVRSANTTSRHTASSRHP